MDRAALYRIINEAEDSGRALIVDPQSKEILRACSIDVPEYRFVKDVDSAVEEAEELGYPLVLKVVSSQIVHKSDVGGVELDIKDRKDLEQRWSAMIMSISEKDPTAVVEGFVIEKMVPQGIEVIVGGLRDEQFGPAVMFGLGGVAVELLKDVSFALAPLDKNEALALMKEVKAYPLLTGFRSPRPADINALSDVIVKVSRLVDEIEEIKEFEINPLMVYNKGVVAVDARAVISRKSPPLPEA